MKVCFTASSGGHLEQLLMLRPLIEKYDGFIVTEATSYEVAEGFKVYTLKQVNRREVTFMPYMIFNSFASMRIFLKERPDVIVSTGVLATIPMCLIGKIARKKLVYIESFAKTSSPTETGKLLERFSDRFYVQWENMLNVYPNAIYVGSVY